jgi:ubiquinone/menaquinone biosynthesis C-methylase UbiE
MNMLKASLAKNPSEVAAMFDRVAAKYDITNDVLAFGLTHSWRRATAQAVSAKKGELVLDLAAGTGTSSIAFSKSGATVIPCDFFFRNVKGRTQTFSTIKFLSREMLYRCHLLIKHLMQ